ncbi:MAG: glycerophosphodiester phosphodiesterase [Gallionella sp.]
MNDQNKSLIYAHRGANQVAPENTRSAFDRALKYAIDGIETDVQLTRDDVTVLWHDQYLDKVGLPDKHIDDFNLVTLQTLNFAAHDSTTRAPEKLMTLQAFLDRYQNRCHFLLEIKNRDGETQARQQLKVRQTLDLAGNRGQLLVSSFHLESLAYAHQHTPACSLIYNIEAEQHLSDIKHLLTTHPYLEGLCLPIISLNETITSLLRDYGKRIAVYTCNSEAQIKLALDLNVDMIISDVPQKALAIRAQR